MLVWYWLMRTTAESVPQYRAMIMSKIMPLSMASTEMGTLDRKRRMAAFWFTVTSEMTSSSLAAFPPRMPATAAASMPFIPSVLGTTTLLTFLMMLLLTPIFTRSGSQPSTSRALAAA